jgi:hypothetical protein
MDDDDSVCIKVMLNWLYTNHYDPESYAGLDSSIAFNAEIADLADKYDLSDLAVAAWEDTLLIIAGSEWPDDFKSDLAAVFTHGRDTKSYFQA